MMFVSGILTSIATGAYLFQNSVMLGCFETFFAQHGLLYESFLAVFLHGTLEISAIIIAAAGGLAIGNGWLFPGTYSRLVSFRRGAKRGLKIVAGTVPVFILPCLHPPFPCLCHRLFRDIAPDKASPEKKDSKD